MASAPSPVPWRAATTARSAAAPSGTATLPPERRPLRTDARILSGVVRPVPSVTAKVPTISPAASFGSQAFFCASVPASSRNSAAR